MTHNVQGFALVGIHVPLLGLAVTYLPAGRLFSARPKYNCWVSITNDDGLNSNAWLA